MENNNKTDTKQGDLEKKIVEVENLLNDLTVSDDEDNWDEEEMAKNERLLQFVMSSSSRCDMEELEDVKDTSMSMNETKLFLKRQNEFKLITKTGFTKVQIEPKYKLFH